MTQTPTTPAAGADIDFPPPPPTTKPEQRVQDVRRTLVWLVAALVVAAAVFACFAGFRLWQAGDDESIALAKTRDQVLIAAHTNIETLTSLDHRKVDEGLDGWLDATTGELHDELAKVGEEDRKAISDAAKVTTGRVVDAAVIDLSAGGDSASVIAAVEISVDPLEGETTLKRNRFSADLVLADGVWKLASLDQVPVVSP